MRPVLSSKIILLSLLFVGCNGQRDILYGGGELSISIEDDGTGDQIASETIAGHPQNDLGEYYFICSEKEGYSVGRYDVEGREDSIEVSACFVSELGGLLESTNYQGTELYVELYARVHDFTYENSQEYVWGNDNSGYISLVAHASFEQNAGTIVGASILDEDTTLSIGDGIDGEISISDVSWYDSSGAILVENTDLYIDWAFDEKISMQVLYDE